MERLYIHFLLLDELKHCLGVGNCPEAILSALQSEFIKNDTIFNYGYEQCKILSSWYLEYMVISDSQGLTGI